ncbi:hypothetical protein HOP50_18g82200 [Chloropicon primus]|uniref:Uncharacterized protein n=1 Tax=Chloropicon primus TaxID=1764295 RepID=A0A5B8MYQ6_9CHLO|nr:hypothetical protein A3770_18p81970 [Chloropicon primus]UPR04875.1 hypothetical protein HOP50_18g82200 [Chloropicon primus]|eukprot:QDZ25679.1 hypothetical protein A3770_18p81970 [Chloropicon primus]
MLRGSKRDGFKAAEGSKREWSRLRSSRRDDGRTNQAEDPTGRRRGLLSSLALSVAAIKFASMPGAAHAFGATKGKDANPYAEMLKKQGRGTMTAEKLYESGGGACGNGYELKVEKVLGSSCVCVDQAVCGEGTEGERKDISLYERSFGKDE